MRSPTAPSEEFTTSRRGVYTLTCAIPDQAVRVPRRLIPTPDTFYDSRSRRPAPPSAREPLARAASSDPRQPVDFTKRESPRSAREFPFPLAYLPSGFFDNSSLERYLRHNIERRGLTNDFRALYRMRKTALYIVAMNLDTAERVVFGHDEDTTLTISEAVQASTALPGFYKRPASRSSTTSTAAGAARPTRRPDRAGGTS